MHLSAARLRDALPWLASPSSPGVARPKSSDPSGVRGALRHRLAAPTSILAICVLFGAALLGVGNQAIFIALAAVTAFQVLIHPVLRALGHQPSPSFGFRVVVVTWPVALAAMSAAGWTNTSDYHGEIVTLLGLITAGFVAMVEPTALAVVWAVAAVGCVVAGATIGGAVTAETLISAGAILVGTAFGERLRHIIETVLGDRRKLLEETTRIPAGRDPFATAKLLLEPLSRWTPVKNPGLIWFTPDGRSVFLAVAGENLPAQLAPGRELPSARNEYLRKQAEQGPWTTGWTVVDNDDGYSRGIASLGIQAGAYVPLVHEGRLLGLLAAGWSNQLGDQSAMAEYLPALVEVAQAAATALGPALAELEQRSTASQVVNDVIRGGRYWPVYQPICRLSDRAVVGFEALARFDAPVTTQRLFVQAALVGRMRDLEIATMRAAAEQARYLPAEAWVSVNASAELLIDTDTLSAILEPIRQRVIIELSEHELITDYAPIAAAIKRLGPGRSLAVDDAGAGFASLRHILEVRPAHVKLDMGLVQGVAKDLTRTALIAGFVRFAHDAGFSLIAEGIETQEDLDALARLGVELGQGYLLGRPDRPMARVADWPPAA
jgi:EAL domain-containing protein (putative c-di-GMP-specific phosphodiesterase class I)